jgi:ligand-binding sensor protein
MAVWCTHAPLSSARKFANKLVRNAPTMQLWCMRRSLIGREASRAYQKVAVAFRGFPLNFFCPLLLSHFSGTMLCTQIGCSKDALGVGITPLQHCQALPAAPTGVDEMHCNYQRVHGCSGYDNKCI